MLAVMLTSQRKQHILQQLARDGRVVVTELSASLGISEDTVRRDLRELDGSGLLQRVHGGALPASQALADFATRETLVPDEKRAIGAAAAKLVLPGQVVFMDGGTSAVQMAQQLDPQLRATVITHSPSIALALVGHAGVTVRMIGGLLFKHSVVCVGAEAIEQIARIRADTYFMGVSGIHPQAGLCTGDSEEASIKRLLMAAAAQTVVLASSEKLGVGSPFCVAPVSAAHTLVVSDATPAEVLKDYAALGIALVVAGGGLNTRTSS
jgi:DeoR/GlpR family transcriptional regulator of sugar metabolism